MNQHPEYDYIVVGAGSAGCVLANRLSADPTRSVLVLEAGPVDSHQNITVPAAFNRLFQTALDWNYNTTAQDHLSGRQIYWPRGKMLGGCSSINAHIYLRGHREDYDEWARSGNAGWGYDDLLPFFKKSERNERGADEFHGVDGPVTVSDLRDPHLLSRAFVEAAGEQGIPANPDFNGRQLDGAGLLQVTVKNGRRCSSAEAFLRPALRRRNLSVQTDALVQRVIFERNNACAITYAHNGRNCMARARREIILCGGAVNSPHLLMLSGVGPADHLRQHNIPVISDSPGVGNNLQDHLLILTHHAICGMRSLLSATSFFNILRYFLCKRGWLTSSILEAAAFVRSRENLSAPDLELGFAPVLYVNQGLTPPTEHGFTLGAALLQPNSAGSILLQSADPTTPPRIDPRYLSDPEGDDLRTLVDGVRLSRQIASSAALAPYRSREISPGSGSLTQAELEAFVRSQAHTIYHPVGTCKMGVDPLAVVDPSLRVRGVTGLRVADASILPTNIRGHTNAPAILVGEKAAVLILQG